MIALSPDDQRALAAEVCTTKQAEAWELVRLNGLSLRTVSLALGISTTAVTARVRRADQLIASRIRSEFPAKPTQESATLTLEQLYALPNLDPTTALLLQRDGLLCYLCKQRPAAGQYRVEHIIPRHLGGTHDPRNLALSCAPCNTRKAGSLVSMLVTSGRPVYTPATRV